MERYLKLGIRIEHYNWEWGGTSRSGLGTGWDNIHDSHHNISTVTETACVETLVCIITFVQEGTHTAMTAVCCGILETWKLAKSPRSNKHLQKQTLLRIRLCNIFLVWNMPIGCLINVWPYFMLKICIKLGGTRTSLSFTLKQRKSCFFTPF